MEAVTSARPVAVCSSCGMGVRFMEGFPPDLSGWRDGVCPSCVRRERRSQIGSMSADEQREMVMEEIRRNPTVSVRELCRVTLVDRPTVVAARNQAVREGIAPRTPDSVKRKRGDRRIDSGRELREADLAYLRENPGVSRNEFAEGRGITPRLATARLGRLVKAERARRYSVPGKRTAYEAV